MNEGRASAYGKEIRAKALPLKEEEIMRSLTYWNTAKYTSMCIFLHILDYFHFGNSHHIKRYSTSRVV